MQDMQSMGRYRFFSSHRIYCCTSFARSMQNKNGWCYRFERVCSCYRTSLDFTEHRRQYRLDRHAASFAKWYNQLPSIYQGEGCRCGRSIFDFFPFHSPSVNTRTQATLAQDFLVNFGIQSDSTSNYSLFIGSAFVSLPRLISAAWMF